VTGVPYIIAGARDGMVMGLTIADNYNGEQEAGSGIYSENDNLRVKDCIIRDCNIGIYLKYRCSSIIYNNTIDNNMLHGIFMQQENGPQIYNNIISNNRSAGIYRNDDLPSMPPLIEYNNCFGNGVNYGYTQNAWTPEPGTGELSEDPLFVGGVPFDYHLMQNSPCIDAGKPGSQKDEDGTRADMGALAFYQVSGVSAAVGAQPGEFRLLSAYPNPFNPETNIAFHLPEAAYVELIVFNILGEQIVQLADGQMQAGEHSRTWQGTDSRGRSVPTGLYFYKLIVRSAANSGILFSDNKKMMLIK
jgi:parallel beta-helix repeat protein